MRGRLAMSIFLAALPAVAGCAAPAVRGSTPASTGQKVGEVVNQPLVDLNVSRTEIPVVLLRAKATTFVLPWPETCFSIQREIDRLTKVLGPAFSNTPTDGARPARDSDLETSAWGAARSASGGLLPFRGVVRWITGADKHDRKIRQAVLAGYVRRAYLEGIRDSRRCARPAPMPRGDSQQ